MENFKYIYVLLISIFLTSYSSNAAAPTTQTSVIYFSAISTTSLTIKWTSGNGANRAVFVKSGSGAITNPTNNTTYTANTAFGSGTQLGVSGYYCVYNGASTTVTVTGLTQGTTYYVQSFEYNGGAGAETYYTATATANPNYHEAAPTGTTYFTVGSGAPTYSAIETAHNAATGANPYIIELLPNYSYASETLPITLNWQTNRSNTNTITIRPQTGVTSISMSGSSSGATIFDWENKYVTLDGRAGSTGSSVMTIENTATASTSTAFDINSSSNGPVDYSTIQYCTIKGSNSNYTGTNDPGVIHIRGYYSTGVNYLTIDNCTIANGSGGNPGMLICTYNGSLSSGSVNSNISITNNTFSNFKVYAIYLKSSETSNTWTITGNSFFQSASQTPISDVQVISINSGSGHTITGNYIGGQAANCGGSAYTLSTSAFGFNGIYFSSLCSGGSTNTISNNTISNLSITNSSADPFYGIKADGSSTFTIGSSGNGNVVGSTSGTGSITISTSYAGTCYVIMISNRSSGSSNTISYNTVGSITLSGTATACYLEGVELLSAGTSTVSYNTIGNSTASNITISSSNYGYVAIYSDAGSNTTVTYNTIQNFNVSQTGSTIYAMGIYLPGSSTNSVTYNTIGNSTSNNMTFAINDNVQGIYSSAGTNTISNNTIQQHQLTSTNTSAQFEGIYITNGCSTAQTISSNTIKNITSSGTNTSSTSLTGVCGIYFSGITGNTSITSNRISNLSITATASSYTITGININSASGTHTISKNKCTGFNNAGNNASSIIAGIYLQNGTTNLYNNVILLNNGANTGLSINIYGIRYETTLTGVIYHNTIKIYGTATSLSGLSACLWNNVSSTLTVKNNLFQNVRTNSGGSGSHYAIYFQTNPGTLTEDYNYLEGSGTGGFIGYYGANKSTIATWRTASSKDVNSKSTTITVDQFGAVPAASASDVKNTGTNLSATVSTDFDGNARSTTPYMGAFETGTALPISLFSFTAEMIRNTYVELNWITASEINNDYFTIEKTQDGLNYEVVDIVKGAINSQQKIHYSLNDWKPYSGLSYYRLKQTDINGNFTYSKLISVNKTIENETKTIIYPNPNNGEEFVISFNYPIVEVCSIEIYNQLSNKVSEFEKLPINNEIKIQSSQQLKSGTYFILVKNSFEQQILKMVVQ